MADENKVYKFPLGFMNLVFLSCSVRKIPFPVRVCCSALPLQMRGKLKSVTVETKPGQGNPDFKKSRDGFVLLVPAN